MPELGKRQMERFTLNVPAVIRLKNNKKPESNIAVNLQTKNICAGGTFIITDTPLDIGTEVDVDLFLSFYNGNITHECRSNIHISGSIIRIEPGGMAIQFDEKYEIIPIPKGSRSRN